MPGALPHTNRNASTRQRLLVPALLLAGLLLRIYFQRRWAYIATDSLLYQDIALNWLHSHVYGLSDTVPPRPTLIRLPGYPAILAALAWVFDRWFHPAVGSLRSFRQVLWLQIVADLGTCWLVSSVARRMFGRRAGLIALALACLCPFTANYTAVPLTETFTLFFLTLAFWTLQRWRDEPSSNRIVLLATALAAGILLRPDQSLLVLAIVPAMLTRPTLARLKPVILCLVLIAVPFIPWAARNWHTFHVIQPLAPKQAVDPGEPAPLGFEHWFRTWAADFTANDDAYWNYPEDPILVDTLPSRAFDSPTQHAQTAALLQRSNAAGKLDPQVERAFMQLGDERIRANPFRYYVVLPSARLVNMLFHPRVEMLPIDNRWLSDKAHPWKIAFAWAYAALNLALMIAAIAGFSSALRADKVLTMSMLAYIMLRCALLFTLDNAEQRYTLEFLPILMVFAAGLARRRALPQTL